MGHSATEAPRQECEVRCRSVPKSLRARTSVAWRREFGKCAEMTVIGLDWILPDVDGVELLALSQRARRGIVRLRVQVAQWADEQPGTELSRLPIPV